MTESVDLGGRVIGRWILANSLTPLPLWVDVLITTSDVKFSGHLSIARSQYNCRVIAYSGVLHNLTRWVTWRVAYQRRGLITLREQLGSLRAFLAGSMLLILLVRCVVFFFCCYMCLRPVSCVPKAVSELSILDCPFCFLKRLFRMVFNTIYHTAEQLLKVPINTTTPNLYY